MFWQVIDFWFEESDPRDWFRKDPDFDEQLRQRFGQTWQQAVNGELHGWRTEPLGRLAEVIVLDQFSRNLFRDSPVAFAADGQALVLAQEAMRQGAEQELTQIQRNFLYMPFMHSEAPVIHDWALALFKGNGIEASLEAEIRHKAIIDRFGRYPHRNAVLGRVSTPEELEFLTQPGSSF
ncbi:DUF924 family protein [Parathalassolituus penaei]|uniref:DUF924 domain-containing protein n=1 Tax=Parathalassolituus penaei TaxID=2997323 RepID=A0A9X3IUE0_9GAMM|nr:DUF924 family protein [Parathalassolituus penaei]MCY0966068.1 DUF924 domain-containing protein [Parathalassolituus penaei]